MWITAFFLFWEILWGDVDQKRRKFASSLEGDTSGQDFASHIF